MLYFLIGVLVGLVFSFTFNIGFEVAAIAFVVGLIFLQLERQKGNSRSE